MTTLEKQRRAFETIKEFERTAGQHRLAVTVGDAEASEHLRQKAHHLLDAYFDMVTEIARG